MNQHDHEWRHADGSPCTAGHDYDTLRCLENDEPVYYGLHGEEDSVYLKFVFRGHSLSGKTQQWEVHSKSSGNRLADIIWFGPWRQYIFVPSSGNEYHQTYWNPVCLREVANFLEQLTQSHRAQLRAVKS